MPNFNIDLDMEAQCPWCDNGNRDRHDSWTPNGWYADGTCKTCHGTGKLATALGESVLTLLENEKKREARKSQP